VTAYNSTIVPTPLRRVVVTLLVVFALAGATAVRAQQTGAADADAETPTAAVEVDGVQLFRVRGVSSLPAQERAKTIRDQLTAVASDRSIPVDALRLVDANGVTRIAAADHPVMTVVDADARLEQVGRLELATSHLSRIRRAITDYRDARSPGALRRSITDTLVATALLALVGGGLFWGGKRVDAFLTQRLRTRISSIGIQSFEVVRAERIWNAVRGIFLTVRLVAGVAALLIFVGYVLARFPATRSMSHGMVAFTLVPLTIIGGGFVRNIPSFVFLAVLYVVVRVALRIVRLFFDAVRERTVTLQRFEPEWADPTYNLVRLGVVAFALIVAYPYIPGSDTAAFRGVSVFIGIVFSLGSSTAIANIVAGYMMTYRKALKVGDRVKIGDVVGEVIETRMGVTHLRSVKNEEITIPNVQIMGTEVLNYSSLSRTRGLILHTEVGIGYETPWRQVEAMLLAAAGRTEGLERDPGPFVLLKRLGDFAVVYELNAYCRDVSAMIRLYSGLHRNILDVFNEYGVQIMTPAYEGDPPEPKVVPPASWYTAPAEASQPPGKIRS